MRAMNRFFLLLACAAGLAALPAARGRPAEGVLLDSYSAIVNGKVITVGDVLAALRPAQERLAARYAGRELEQKLAEEFNAARDALVESELILVDFEMQGGSLPDRAIEDHVNSVIHDRFGNDRAAFLKALAAERLTFGEWRQQMKDQLIVQIRRQQEVGAKILITPLDLQTAYAARRDTDFARPERVRLRTLALPAAADGPVDPVQLERVRTGQVPFDADAFAGAVFQDAGDFLDVSSLNEATRAALAGLQPGDVSPPIEIAGTAYLLQLVERQPARIVPFDEAAPEVRRDLRRAEFERLNRIWINSLRAKYHVQLFTHNLFD